MSELAITREAKATLQDYLRRLRRAKTAVKTGHLDHAEVYLESLVRDLANLTVVASIVDPLPPRHLRGKKD